MFGRKIHRLRLAGALGLACVLLAGSMGTAIGQDAARKPILLGGGVATAPAPRTTTTSTTPGKVNEPATASRMVREPTSGGGAAAGQLGAYKDYRRRNYLRDNAEFLEQGEQGWPAARGEILAMQPTPEALKRALAAGYRILREDQLEGLDMKLVVLSAPKGASTRSAIRRLRKLDPAGSYEFNHLYEPSGGWGAAIPTTMTAVAMQADAPASVRVGLIDTGVADGHPAMAGARMVQKSFVGSAPVALPHGTAVASLLVGRGRGFRSAAAGASLYVADVYGTSRAGGAGEQVARALAWMAQNRVGVVNISLVGPDSPTLRAVINAMVAKGHIVVAAVGNDGPASPALYPAAYPGTVAVTGVDSALRVLPEAGRGTHVDFAAPGSDMTAADQGSGWSTVRGTSYAAPLVAGRLARLLPSPDPAGARGAIAALAREAVDLGERGPDRVYGQGLVAADLRIRPASASASVRAAGGG